MAVHHNEGEEDATTTSFVEEGGGDHQKGMCVQTGLTHLVAIIRYTVQAEIKNEQGRPTVSRSTGRWDLWRQTESAHIFLRELSYRKHA